MNRMTTLTKILLLLAVVGLTAGVCIVAGCATVTKQPAPPVYDSHPPPYPVPTKTMQPVAPQSVAPVIAPVPYAVVGQRYADQADGTRVWYVTLRAGTGERFEVEAEKAAWAQAAFDKTLCLSGHKAVVCPR